MELLALLFVVVPWELPVICGIGYLTRRRWLGPSRASSNSRLIGYLSPLSLLMRFIANLRNRGSIVSALKQEGGN